MRKKQKLFLNMTLKKRKQVTLKSIIKEIDTKIDAYKKTLNVDFNVFLYNGNEDLSHISKPCNIILSPMFYWVKKESLPVNSISKASKLAPSCFGSQVPEGEYSYFAIQDNKDNDFILFAYDKKNIVNAIKNSNINLSLINKIYLTQNEFTSDIIQITNDKCLYKKDGIYVVLPTTLLKEDIEVEKLEIEIRNIKKSKHNLSINLDDGAINSKHINILSISIFIITLSLAIRYFVLKNDYNQIAKKENSIINTYRIPTSSLQLKSIKKSLEKKLSKEIKIKENIQNVFDIPLKSGDFIRDIEIIDNRFMIAISLKDKNNTNNVENAENYKTYLIQYFELKSLKVKNGILAIKGEF
jgi:hypothetical protein